MKFSLIPFVLGTLALVSSLTDAASTFRKKKKPQPSPSPARPPKHFYVGTIVTLEHVLDGTQVDAVDPDVVIECFAHAYNTIHKGDDIEIDSGFVYKTYVVPEDDNEDDDADSGLATTTTTTLKGGRPYNPFRYWGRNTFYVWFDARCRLCDDSYMDDLDDRFDDGMFPNRRPNRRNDDRWTVMNTASVAATTPTNKMDVDLIQASHGYNSNHNPRAASMHRAFVEEYCLELRASSAVPLKDLAHCEVEFTYTTMELADLHDEELVFGSFLTKDDNDASISESKPEEEELNESPSFVETTTTTTALSDIKTTTTTTTTGTTECHLNIDHVHGSTFQQADLQLIARIFQDSYNQIFLSLPYKVTGVELLRRIDIPEKNEDGTVTPSDNPHGYYSRTWWIKADFECDDEGKEAGSIVKNGVDPVAITTDGVVGAATNAVASACHRRLPPTPFAMHKALEALVCTKLVHSGLFAYNKARDCEIDFVWKPRQPEDEMDEDEVMMGLAANVAAAAMP